MFLIRNLTFLLVSRVQSSKFSKKVSERIEFRFGRSPLNHSFLVLGNSVGSPLIGEYKNTVNYVGVPKIVINNTKLSRRKGLHGSPSHAFNYINSLISGWNLNLANYLELISIGSLLYAALQICYSISIRVPPPLPLLSNIHHGPANEWNRRDCIANELSLTLYL